MCSLSACHDSPMSRARPVPSSRPQRVPRALFRRSSELRRSTTAPTRGPVAVRRPLRVPSVRSSTAGTRGATRAPHAINRLAAMRRQRLRTQPNAAPSHATASAPVPEGAAGAVDRGVTEAQSVAPVRAPPPRHRGTPMPAAKRAPTQRRVGYSTAAARERARRAGLHVRHGAKRWQWLQPRRGHGNACVELWHREACGRPRIHRMRVYNRVPPRLCIPLRRLLKASAMDIRTDTNSDDDGGNLHPANNPIPADCDPRFCVFLGFSRTGNHVCTWWWVRVVGSPVFEGPCSPVWCSVILPRPSAADSAVVATCDGATSSSWALHCTKREPWGWRVLVLSPSPGGAMPAVLVCRASGANKKSVAHAPM